MLVLHVHGLGQNIIRKRHSGDQEYYCLKEGQKQTSGLQLKWIMDVYWRSATLCPFVAVVITLFCFKCFHYLFSHFLYVTLFVNEVWKASSIIHIITWFEQRRLRQGSQFFTAVHTVTCEVELVYGVISMNVSRYFCVQERVQYRFVC